MAWIYYARAMFITWSGGPLWGSSCSWPPAPLASWLNLQAPCKPPSRPPTATALTTSGTLCCSCQLSPHCPVRPGATDPHSSDFTQLGDFTDLEDFTNSADFTGSVDFTYFGFSLALGRTLRGQCRSPTGAGRPLGPRQEHRTLHLHMTPYTACCTLHTECCTLHTECCTLHTECCTPHTACCTLHPPTALDTIHCMLHTAHYYRQTAHCMLHTEHYKQTLHTTY